MKANVSIDVSLLAIILAMYFTKQNDKFILILIATLVAHILMTSEYERSTENDEYLDEDESDDELLGNVNQSDDTQEKDLPQENKTYLSEETEKQKPRFTPMDHVKSTVSSGVFERNISTPQSRMTNSILPKTSQEANGKLANSRGSFFETLVS